MATAVFDLDELVDRLGGDTETVAELIEIFLEDTPPRVAEIRDHTIPADGVRRAAHTLKGASGNMGAHAASEAAARLEAAAKGGDERAVEAARAGLLDEMDRLFAELARRRDDLARGLHQ